MWLDWYHKTITFLVLLGQEKNYITKALSFGTNGLAFCFGLWCGKEASLDLRTNDATGYKRMTLWWVVLFFVILDNLDFEQIENLRLKYHPFWILNHLEFDTRPLFNP
jgi:hypothetical protein